MRRGSARLLGNVTFIERPFHPTTLVSIVGSAVRGRRRQYQTRAILRRPHRKRRPAADRAERRPSRRAGIASAGVRARSLRAPARRFSAAGRTSRSPIRTCWRRFIPTIGRGVWTCVEQTHQDRQGLQHRIPQYLARRLAALGRRARPRGAPARRQHQIAGRRLFRHHRAQDCGNRAREPAGAAGRRAHRAGGIDRKPGAARRAAHRRSDEGSRRARKGAGAVAAGPEDGNDRPAHRRRRA